MELRAHEEPVVFHSIQPDRERSTIEVNDLHQGSVGRHFVGDSMVAIPQKLLRCRHIHHVVAVEIIVNESKCALSIRQSKHNLRNPRSVLVVIIGCLEEIIECARALLHDRSHNRHIGKGDPRKGFITLAHG